MRRREIIKFKRRKYNRGHSVEGIWVFGAVEWVTRNILLVPVERKSREVLEEIIFRSIDKNSVVYSDCWKAYRNLGNHFYKHCTVNHSKKFVRYSADGSIHTNSIEGNWSAVKRKFPVKCKTSRLIDLHLLRFILFRNDTCPKLSKLLVLSLFHNYKKMKNKLINCTKSSSICLLNTFKTKLFACFFKMYEKKKKICFE